MRSFPLLASLLFLNYVLNCLALVQTSKQANNAFDDIVKARSACTRFQRHNDAEGNSGTIGNETIVDLAYSCLDLARRAPSGFNAQPYRAILVRSPSVKEKLSKYCIGRNADRVRDSDCSIVFLADREVGRDGSKFGRFCRENFGRRKKARNKALNEELSIGNNGKERGNVEETLPTMSKFAEFKIRSLVLLFSSGYPLPRIISSPFSFFVRLGVSIVSVLSRRRILVPSLSGAETWAVKNTMLVAMTYMLAATSRGLATCPMEGFNAGGVRKALKIPRRYSVSLIVSTGEPYIRAENNGEDDVGMSHGVDDGISVTPRYASEDVLKMDYFASDGQ